MGYQQALDKAWSDIESASTVKRFSVKLLSDMYEIDVERRSVVASSCGVAARDHTAILILHYLFQKLALKEQLPGPSGEWIDFGRLEGGEGYYPAFRKRTIDRVAKKYGPDPKALLAVTGRMPAKAAPFGDAAVIVYPFVETAILIKVSKADEEFGPDANILFDGNINRIFCTEDIVVLTEMVVHQL